MFHQWLDLCTFTPDRTGDYYLQVRTNVALGGISDGEGGYDGNAAVYSQTGDNNSGPRQREQPVRRPPQGQRLGRRSRCPDGST